MITTTLLPPAPRGPGGLNPLVPLAFIVGLLVGLFPGLTAPPARAAVGDEIIGYQIVLKACAGEDCRSVEVPGSLWPGQFACESRATTVAAWASMMAPQDLGLPAGEFKFRGSCAPAFGRKGA